MKRGLDCFVKSRMENWAMSVVWRRRRMRGGKDELGRGVPGHSEPVDIEKPIAGCNLSSGRMLSVDRRIM